MSPHHMEGKFRHNRNFNFRNVFNNNHCYIIKMWKAELFHTNISRKTYLSYPVQINSPLSVIAIIEERRNHTYNSSIKLGHFLRGGHYGVL